jgi:hypothetical protein
MGDFSVHAERVEAFLGFFSITAESLLLCGPGFVYFKGSENVNLFVEADLKWTRNLKARICLAAKNPD